MNKIPGLLHINRKSRQVGLGFYIKMLTRSSLNCIYINPLVDTLLLVFYDARRFDNLSYNIKKEYVADIQQHMDAHPGQEILGACGYFHRPDWR